MTETPTAPAGGQRIGRGRPQKWPWETWLDGERHVLNSQDHFPGVSVRSLRQQVLNEAARRGVEVTTRISINPFGDGLDYLEVKSPEDAAPKGRIDWDALFEQLPRMIRRGREFTCSVESMRVRIYQAAQRRGRQVTTAVEYDRITISEKE